MIVLDTNVISELFRPAPDARVMAWMDQQTSDVLFTTAITRGELLFGVHCMSDGRRKEMLMQGLVRILDQRLDGRILPYDSAAADAYAEIAAGLRAQGRVADQADMMIAGIARLHGASLATRNTRHFDHCAISLINPWH
ncbi:MAG TPA: type II toxin-antitoxin system VapC family toxin [Rudaea sp.]|nr:type II toxin-antitoxin system VapC family toxin [Rudaea sp.]